MIRNSKPSPTRRHTPKHHTYPCQTVFGPSGCQLGYKMAKYVMHIQLVASYRPFGQGQGGYWEDQGYAWYAGILD